MASAERFEELEVWQRARELTNDVYRLSATASFAKDFGLRDQIRRASVSVLSNIAEGFERNSDADFGRFLLIAKGSAGEVRAQLYVALDQDYLDERTFLAAKKKVERVSRLLSRLIAYLKHPPRQLAVRGGSASLSPRQKDDDFVSESTPPFPFPHPSSLATPPTLIPDSFDL